MFTAAPRTHSPAGRTQDKPHAFATPVVREIPRPAMTWNGCWVILHPDPLYPTSRLLDLVKPTQG